MLFELSKSWYDFSFKTSHGLIDEMPSYVINDRVSYQPSLYYNIKGTSDLTIKTTKLEI